MLTAAEFLASPSPKVVIYHKNCMDGFGAAFAAWKALGDKAVYLPHAYGDPISGLPAGRCTILMADVSFPRDWMEAVAKDHDLVVLDHHATAKEALQDFDNALFDMERSGCMMTWNYFFPDVPAPGLLHYIMDRDLWRFKIPHSQEANACYASYDCDFKVWDELIWKPAEHVVQEGRAILRYQNQLVARMAQNAMPIELEGEKGVYATAPVLQSEVCHYLLEKHPQARYAAAAFTVSTNVEQISLRSRKLPEGTPEFDVGALAKKLGGGGHPCAAGFRIVSD